MKSWWQSRAFIGALATIAASLAGIAGYTLDAGQLTDLVLSAITLASGILALIGTAKRKEPIDPRKVLPGVSLPPVAQSDPGASSDRSGGVREPGVSPRPDRNPFLE